MFMYKLLIIDNEPVIRNGLKRVIPWGQYGYQICGTAVDGKDGIEKINQEIPDLILLDIKMPRMSGIELVHLLRKSDFHGEIIILSAHSNFSYAKELMSLGINYYLLKPIKENELIGILESIEVKRQEKRRVQAQLHLYQQLHEEKIFRLLLDGEISKVPPEKLKDLQGNHFQVAKMLGENQTITEKYVYELVEKHSKNVRVCQKEGCKYFLFIGMDESFVDQFLTRLLHQLSLYDYDNFYFLVGEMVDRPNEIHQSVHQIKLLASIHFSVSHERIFTFKHVKGNRQSTNQEFHQLDKQNMIHFIEFRDYQGINKECRKLEQYYQQAMYQEEQVKSEIIDWFLTIIRTIQTDYPSIDTLDQHLFVQKVYEQENLESLLQYVSKEFRSMSSVINKKYFAEGNIVEKVLEYMNQYYDKDLSLKYVAELFFYNNAYLGKAFKKQTGKYFNEYLREIRIEKAKKLLINSHQKIYEISKLVGYSNSDYFYKNFKELEGMSPKEFQMKYKQKGE